MKTLALISATAAILCLAACGDERCCSDDEVRAAHQNAAGSGEAAHQQAGSEAAKP